MTALGSAASANNPDIGSPSTGTTRRAAGEAGVHLITEPAQRLGGDRREALLIEGQALPGRVVVAVEVAQDPARERAEGQAVAAVTQSIVEIAARTGDAHRADAVEGDAERAGPAVGDGDVVEVEFSYAEGPDSALPNYFDLGRFRFQSPEIPFHRSELIVLAPEAIAQVVAVMRAEGMNATVSSIHVNGWFGDHDKLSGARWMAQRLFGSVLDDELDRWVYVGDSTNDQLMFEHFPLSVGVANLMRFAAQLHTWPAWISAGERGRGFAEVAQRLLAARGA
mgnify:CR=1 FL=1